MPSLGLRGLVPIQTSIKFWFCGSTALAGRMPEGFEDMSNTITRMRQARRRESDDMVTIPGGLAGNA